MSYFPPTQQQSSAVKDTIYSLPKSYGQLSLKSAPDTVVSSSSTSFKDYINKWGTTKVFTASATNTWHTLWTYTGAGNLYNVITPGLGSTGVMKIKITIDGESSEISESTGTYSRICLGYFTLAYSTSNSATYTSHLLGENTYPDNGFKYPYINNVMIASPMMAKSNSRVNIRFNQSIKVEVQYSVALYNSAPFTEGYATYLLN